MVGCEWRGICSQYKRNAYERKDWSVDKICFIDSGVKRECELYGFFSGEEDYVHRERENKGIVKRAKNIARIRFWRDISMYLNRIAGQDVQRRNLVF